MKVIDVNTLPDYPRVRTNDQHVIICHEDGSEELWAEFKTVDEAVAIASRLETSLRVIKFVSSSLEDNVAEIRSYLESIAVPVDVVDEALAEGLYGVTVKHVSRYWNRQMCDVEHVGLKAKDGSLSYLFDVAVLLRERENYFHSKREAVEGLLKGKLDKTA
jgi:hypothetical protein